MDLVSNLNVNLDLFSVHGITASMMPCSGQDILDRVVKRGMERKSGHPSIIGIDEKSYRKGQLYSTLLELKSPWKVEKVSLNSVRKTVDIYITHVKGSKLVYPICRKE